MSLGLAECRAGIDRYRLVSRCACLASSARRSSCSSTSDDGGRGGADSRISGASMTCPPFDGDFRTWVADDSFLKALTEVDRLAFKASLAFRTLMLLIKAVRRLPVSGSLSPWVTPCAARPAASSGQEAPSARIWSNSARFSRITSVAPVLTRPIGDAARDSVLVLTSALNRWRSIFIAE